ncbi:hypothetical protein VHEMI08855 [[Torrubiella] hemipterigena]|uniref:Protein yippee-like n=1 Tax=[Torrubiella] hemipterigena TaxID=1531966 RepID=A0A0A1TP00_9HYPO|nr:hypothetical protein VHEMI08855 [[Torrubiella] hemipterigena]
MVEIKSGDTKADRLQIWACRRCAMPIANEAYITSRNFRGEQGKAALCERVANTKLGEEYQRNMTTGRHTIRDLFCESCNQKIGWKYIHAPDPSQEYKIGRYIVELELLDRVPN